MSGPGLWIAENVWTFLGVGLVLSAGLAVAGVRSMRRAVRRVRGGEASRRRPATGP